MGGRLFRLGQRRERHGLSSVELSDTFTKFGKMFLRRIALILRSRLSSIRP